MVLYIIAAVGVNSSMVFYDAFLIDATEPHNYDSLSSKGYAWGYIGSLVPFLLCVALIFGGEAIGLDKASATRISFLITAVWWAVFTIPMIKNVKQLHFKPHAQHSFIQAFNGLAKTMRSIIGNRTLLLFMLAFFCYIDGVHTIIKMATSYGTELGIDSTQLIMALVATQVVAFPAALAFGKLASKLSARTMLIVSVAAYALITLYAAFFLKGATEFWILAISVGLFQGGIQALSRSYFGKLIPKDHCNEYFGFFDIFGKYASIIGTFLVSSITHITGNASLGILSITVLFVLGLVFLFLMPKSVE